MDGWQGRRSSWPGNPARGVVGRGGGMPVPAVGYGGMPGFMYNFWGGHDTYGGQVLFPPMRHPHAYGFSTRPSAPLGVQGTGISKRLAGSEQGPLMHGRGHSRGHGGRAVGARSCKNLTKEALDADLDEWRMKDKKFGGQSLDSDLDEYWKKKADDGGTHQRDGELKNGNLEVEKGCVASLELEAPKEAKVAVPLSPIVPLTDEEKVEQIHSSPADNNVTVSL